VIQEIERVNAIWPTPLLISFPGTLIRGIGYAFATVWAYVLYKVLDVAVNADKTTTSSLDFSVEDFFNV
jgi:hypothetical protein